MGEREVLSKKKKFKIVHCKNGHELTPYLALGGMCDGCKKRINNGDKVMDCRKCNWYLCRDCYRDAGGDDAIFDRQPFVVNEDDDDDDSDGDVFGMSGDSGTDLSSVDVHSDSDSGSVASSG